MVKPWQREKEVVVGAGCGDLHPGTVGHAALHGGLPSFNYFFTSLQNCYAVIKLPLKYRCDKIPEAGAPGGV